jgi:hypothetical protein
VVIQYPDSWLVQAGRPGAFMILDQKGRDSDRFDPRSFRFMSGR